MFPYSDRPKTRASRMPNKVPLEVIQRRKGELLELAEKQAFALREKYIGKELSVLLEGEEKPGFLMGRTDNFLPVYVPKRNLRSNVTIKVKILDNNPEGLIGEHQAGRKI